MKIYVTNLDTAFNSEELTQLFNSYGTVKSAEVVMDVFTGKSRGFAYVEIEDETAAQQAISALNNSEVANKPITVREAKPEVVHGGSYKVGNGSVNVYKFKKN